MASIFLAGWVEAKGGNIMEFSVAIITKNEENTLPRLLKSLEGVKDIVVVDTGSTDKTVSIAKEHGCKVKEVGEKFIEKPTEQDVPCTLR